jgi:hypothetical protein
MRRLRIAVFGLKLWKGSPPLWRAVRPWLDFYSTTLISGTKAAISGTLFPRACLRRNPAGLGALHITHTGLGDGGIFTIDRSFPLTRIDSLVLKFCFFALTP